MEGQMAEKLSSVGRESINVEVRVVDSEGKDVTVGEIGEVIAKGVNIALGCWKLPEETAEIFKDGWLYTGDMAKVDSEGYVYLVDRKKDMIISGGENISSKEVEEVIFHYPAVQEVAVIGVLDEEWGEAVKAVVALNPGSVATEAELIDFCKVRLAGYKKPRSVDFIEELPKNAAGKIDKASLRRFYMEKYKRKE